MVVEFLSVPTGGGQFKMFRLFYWTTVEVRLLRVSIPPSFREILRYFIYRLIESVNVIYEDSVVRPYKCKRKGLS